MAPADAATPPAAAKAEARVMLGGKVSADLAARFRDAASRTGANVSELIAQFIADYVTAARSNV